MSVRAFYGRYADLYDAIATAPGVARWRERAADALSLAPGDTVVEMGCGTGANLPHLRERVGSEGRVVGVDLTRPLLDRARERTARWENVAVVEADATRPPVARADAVLASFVVGMLPDPGAAVDDWCDLAAGRVALLDATSSTHPLGRLLTPAFGAFVGAGAPADSPVDSFRQAVERGEDAPNRRLDRRVGAARDALVSRTVDRRYEEHALGFVGVLSGRVE
ncbi:class I SAM-dependent methyltransferase [Halomarina ordinaria]|uniref:Class I SAM-dependent methyltransferase n=1 Tax=Halomarina ordinaria TaxID=3033939 RepID=A0ABD5U7Y9_9EURY|nr:methyltransferase domain-containing protein [Halomarina sp. PSRA2]